MNFLNVGYCLAEKNETVQEAATRININNAETKVFEKFFGLKNLPIDLETTVEPLLFKAANNCLEQSGVNRSQIKWLLYAHTANHVSPFGESAVRNLQRALNLNNAVAFGMTMNKCGAIFTGFQIANELFVNMKSDEYILIVTGDITYTRTLQHIPGTTITTDGASAVLLSKCHLKNTLLGIEMDLYGQYSGGIWNNSDLQKLFEKNYNQYLSEVIRKLVKKSNLTMNDIKVILPHNVNTFSWKQVARLLNISIEKIFLDNVSETAHCFGSDPFINYQTVLERGLIKPGDIFVLATVGLGATFSAMIFKH